MCHIQQLDQWRGQDVRSEEGDRKGKNPQKNKVEY